MRLMGKFVIVVVVECILFNGALSLSLSLSCCWLVKSRLVWSRLVSCLESMQLLH